jgi:hypothetical protein
MENDPGWHTKGDTATYSLDKNHFLSIKRTKNGFSVKVYNRIKIRGKMTLLYTNSISDSQLGYSAPKETA